MLCFIFGGRNTEWSVIMKKIRKISIFLVLPCFLFSFLGQAEETGQVVLARELLTDKTKQVKILLKTQLISENIVALGNARKSFVVTFREFGNKLRMENAAGDFIDKDLKPNFIITEFPIVKRNSDSIVIDWNEGMQKYPNQRSWYTSDFQEFSEGAWIVAKQSRLLKSRVDGNKITVAQSLVSESVFDGQESRVKVKYTLEPYVKSASFIPYKEEPDKRFLNFAYFEANPILKKQKGEEVIYSAKWDNSKPIVFHMSHNTPEYLKDAIKRGALYWNRTGYLDIKVREAAEGISAPSDAFNMIQWVNVDNLGFAYADLNPDPLTGEILQANIYFSSTYVAYNKDRALLLLRRWEDKKYSAMHLFEKHFLCSKSEEQFSSYVEALRAALFTSTKSTDELVKKISQDYVSVVMAHEVGHILGLRHNFAGSLSSNSSQFDAKAFLKNYLKGTSAPIGYYPSNTVMEYSTFTDRLMYGFQMRVTPSFIGEYDRLAIQNLYSQNRVEGTEEKPLPVFCTDSHLSTYVDCNTRDDNPLLVHNYFNDFRDLVARKRPEKLINRFLLNKYSTDLDDEDKVPFERTKLPPMDFSREAELMHSLLTLFHKESRYISIESKFPRENNEYYKDKIQEEKYKLLNEQLQSLDDSFPNIFSFLMELTFPGLFPDSGSVTLFLAEMHQVKDMLDDQYKNDFTKGERKIILDRARSYFKSYNKEMPLKILSLLNEKISELDFSEASDDNHGFVWLKKLEDSLKDVLFQIVTKKSARMLFHAVSVKAPEVIPPVETVTKEDTKEVTKAAIKSFNPRFSFGRTKKPKVTPPLIENKVVLIKAYAYDIELRSLAAELLLKWPKSKLGDAWNRESREKARKELIKDYKKWKEDYGKDFFSRNHEDWLLLAWIREQKEMIKIFSISDKEL